MTADDIIKAVLQLRGIPGYQLAHEIGWAAQKLSKRLSNETMRILSPVQLRDGQAGCRAFELSRPAHAVSDIRGYRSTSLNRQLLLS